MTTAVLTNIPMSWSESQADRLEALRNAVEMHVGVSVQSRNTFPAPWLTAEVSWSNLDDALYAYCPGLGIGWYERKW